MFKALILTLAKNLLAMLVTQKMIIWALERYADQTKNLVDNAIVQFVKAALDNDADGVREALEKAQHEFNKK